MGDDKKIEVKMRDIRLRQISIAMEACNALFQQVLKINEKGKYKFTDGREAYLRAFAEPYFDDKGEHHPMCVVDFIMPDGHLEFEIKLSGYGGTLKFFAHKGDPCIYCKQPHDQIKSGPCPARVALIDRENKDGDDDGNDDRNEGTEA